MFKEFNLDDFSNSAKVLEELINKNKSRLDELLKIEDKSYTNFVTPYQLLSEELEQYCTPIFHIDGVKNSEETQKVYNECLPLISIYSSQLASNEYVYSAFKDIQYKYNSSLSIEQQKVLENEIRDFKLGGCGLSDDDKKTLEELNLELSELGKDFSQNLLDATNDWEMIIEDEEEVKEIPKSDLENASFVDEKDGKTKYKFTLQMPSYIAYITYGTSQKRREEIYKAYTTRAPQNGKLIEKILILREKEAKLLGFENYAQLSLATKMANKEDDVLNFLYELAKYSKDKAIVELKEVSEFASKDGIEDIQSFDLGYYSQKLKEKMYDIDEEYYRPYFQKDIVLNGLFDFLDNTFGIKFTKVDAPAWDDKAEVYELSQDDKTIARLYIDLEARTDKRGGAWMNNWHTHSVVDDKENLATAYIVCNFPVSTDTTPSLLRHSDVVTLFHEMGHALHHMLSTVEEPFVSGINGVAWDTVEFPSQFLEYFAYDKKVLQMFAKHYETGEVLDDEAIAKLIKARNFQSSLTTMRQLEFALFDFKLHQKLYNEADVQVLLDDIRDTTSVMKPPSYNKFQNGFAHIFAGGYAAGYYSYKWAEVLSADAFYMFIENPDSHKELALKYKEIIFGLGGSIDMNQLFYKFTSRDADIKSLLKIDGIIS
ncbi:MAG: M3 family metallopeptidase [Campylobacterota bacterium]|nr:M3 family metallopeptidase [Campylobacterota bacterium]